MHRRRPQGNSRLSTLDFRLSALLRAIIAGVQRQNAAIYANRRKRRSCPPFGRTKHGTHSTRTRRSVGDHTDRPECPRRPGPARRGPIGATLVSPVAPNSVVFAPSLDRDTGHPSGNDECPVAAHVGARHGASVVGHKRAAPAGRLSCCPGRAADTCPAGEGLRPRCDPLVDRGAARIARAADNSAIRRYDAASVARFSVSMSDRHWWA